MAKKRAIIIVIDSMGIEALPDCAEFGDTDKCNTLKNVCEFNKGLDVPVLEFLVPFLYLSFQNPIIL